MRSTLNCFCFFLAICMEHGFAQSDQYQSVSDAVLARKTLIEAELLSYANAHDWAGEYSQGCGGDSILLFWVAPKNGVVFQWRGNSGVVGEGAGNVDFNGSSLIIDWIDSTYPTSLLSPELILVSLKSHLYLVPPREIHAFCLEYESAYVSHFCLRRKILTSGEIFEKPHLKGNFERFANMPANQTTIVEVMEPRLLGKGKSLWISQSVTLDVGTSQNVIVGSIFKSFEDANQKLRITDVKENTSTAVFDGNFLQRDGFIPLTAGTSFRSSSRGVDISIFRDGLDSLVPKGKSLELESRAGKLFRKSNRGRK